MGLNGSEHGKPGASKDQTYPVEILSPEEVKALMNAQNKGATGTRNKALIALMYRSGLRIAEALDLYAKDIDLEHNTIRVLHGKGDKARTIGVDDGALRFLEAWVTKRQGLGLNGKQPLFCQLDGEPLAQSAVRESLKRSAAKAGIEKRVTPHGLRHTHAAELAQERVPMNLLQAQLGHSSIHTTDRYIKHIAPMEVVEAIKSREW